jgi:hypothetical protein
MNQCIPAIQGVTRALPALPLLRGSGLLHDPVHDDKRIQAARLGDRLDRGSLANLHYRARYEAAGGVRKD